ncbi:septal ring lytic transglycosylase RlpA family protein [Actinomadura parmotrematis]|uniref:Probable endolytic peptidoglycan transglycosylase RlpA n=1 Tax=Actinomadura parmotrematis TaxID=2864039 RepID=A0ABS7FRE7_9ACTN|nr:septal ring lytic transglycosylase RlpA family protein [Actinomadura parmotrematis]MBW8482973.1 septal ring lytic transglycosylase RlpA family protein [Actinomadura parmotrematis]
MGSTTGKHRPRKRARALLVASGAAVAVSAAGARTWALASTGGPSGEAAQVAPAPVAATTAPVADAPRATPSRASRGAPRSTATATPKPKPKKTRKARVLASGSCEASFYGEGQMTASGEAFDPGELTAAHKTLPMGSRVRVTNRGNDRSVVVRINDRGPYVSGRCLDLSTAAMKRVGGLGSGVIGVRYEVLSRG